MRFRVNDLVILCKHFVKRSNEEGRNVKAGVYKVSGITRNGRYNLESVTEPSFLLDNIKSKYLTRRRDGANEIVTLENLTNP